MSRVSGFVFGLLLRAFPAEFRARYGAGMRETFAARWEEHRALGLLRLAGFMTRTAADMLVSGLRERVRPTVTAPGAGAGWTDRLGQDLRFAGRTLRKSPGFATVTILTLGLGIGGATALFSVVEAVLLRPLPFDEPERLVRLWEGVEGGRSSFSTLNFRDVRDRSRSFEAVASYGVASTPVSVGGQVSRVSVGFVSEAFFDVFRVEPVLGRRITSEEFATGAPVAVVAESFWRSRLGADPNLGATPIRSGGQVYTVVGVAPDGTAFPRGAGVWTPRDPQVGESRTGHNWQVVGRLAPGVTLEAARTELSAIAAELEQQYGDDTDMVAVVAAPLLEQMVGSVRPMLLILLGAAGFLLVVACANVTNLLLARGAARRTEVAVRQAVGAGRGRLAGQFLIEALVLSLAGGALGLVLATLGVDALLALEPGQLPRADEVGVNLPVLAFALGVSFFTAAVLGLLTSSRTADDEVHAVLAESGRSRAGGARTRRVRSLLTSLQVAMTLVLLVGAGLLAQSFLRLSAVDPGYRTSGALVIDAYVPSSRSFDPDAVGEDARGVARVRDVLVERLRGLPGVSEVGITNAFPLSGRGSNGGFLVLERPDEVTDIEGFIRLAQEDPARLGNAEYRIASTGYFRAMDIPLVRGRLFDARDEPGAPHAAVVSESLAESRWPGEDAIGKIIQYGNMDGDIRPYTVVGVVGDTRDDGLDAEPNPTFYGNALQRPASLRGTFSLVLVGADVERLGPAVQAAVRDVAPDVPVQVRTLEDIFSSSLAQRRFSLVLLGAFALVAVLLAVTGIYGVISYLVAQRSREWAIRLAFGAGRVDIVRQVLVGGLALVVAGVVVGSAVALAATRVLEGLLYGVAATDASTFIAVALLLTAVSLLASYVPAARATRVDPALAMRE
ncbi:MAG: ABC transporter permease [Gemmatimonadota bacterium]|nr:ABC transporter permease [Gemmatimonadota bacterium]